MSVVEIKTWTCTECNETWQTYADKPPPTKCPYERERVCARCKAPFRRHELHEDLYSPYCESCCLRGSVRSDGLFLRVYFPDDGCVVCKGPCQGH